MEAAEGYLVGRVDVLGLIVKLLLESLNPSIMRSNGFRD